MSKISKAAKAVRESESLRSDEIVKNFMGGDSYKLDPLSSLRIIASSSIFGEASYYRKDVKDGTVYVEEMSHFDDSDKDELNKWLHSFNGKSTTEVFTEAIDASLDFDFEGTLKLAVELRNEYNMRLNPQVIMVRASMNKNREAWTVANPGKFAEYNSQVMSRADEPITQLAYFIAVNKGKKKMPTILKKAVAKKLSSLDAFAVNKYKNAEIGMINAVRLSHANSAVLDELMKTGAVKVEETSKTWEQLKSEGKSWREIIKTIKLGHMALLRNLRGIFTEINDADLCHELMNHLKSGVLKGKQFPFRYYNAYNMIKGDANINHKVIILDALEECIDISIKNMPHLKGKTMCLSDNSGSAWGAITSEYGKTKIAEIDNLSAVIAAAASDEGYVGKFGDKLIEFPISKRNGVLSQTNEITRNGDDDVGGCTEGGIWKFFNKAIANKIFYDNIIIFSDQQAGTGGLYGTGSDIREYVKDGFGIGNHVNVYKLVKKYRKVVNPKCNVMSVQTAGYGNFVLPNMSYRTALCSGWTGKEIQFFDAFIKEWNNIDNKQ